MAAAERETQRLRELHELYVWQINAAVEEGRDDLVAELAEEFTEEALAVLTAQSPGAQGPEPAPPLKGRAGAEVLTAGPSRTARRWWRRARPR